MSFDTQHLSDAFVYFARPVGHAGPVKIGCSRKPMKRLEALAQWAPYPLEIAATCEGGLKREAQFHRKFLAQRSHKEWFHPSDDLTATIAAVAAGTFDFSSLPSPKGLTSVGRRLSAQSRLTVSMCTRLYWAGRHGHVVPPEVTEAARRWSSIYRDEGRFAHQPADAETVLAFLDGLKRAA